MNGRAKTIIAAALLFVLALGRAWADSYVLQSTFTLPFSSIAAMDRDSAGNLYVLGLPNGSTNYAVDVYQTPDLTPALSFAVGVSSPVAFAVEPDGIVDVLGAGNGLVLGRFTNIGGQVSEADYAIGTYPAPYTIPQIMSWAIDKSQGRIYLSYQFTQTYYSLQCIGCASGPASATIGVIDEYDMQGNYLAQLKMPGNSNSGGSCYTPSKMTTDSQGNLYVADPACGQIVVFSAAGTVENSLPASQWMENGSPSVFWTDPSDNLYIGEPSCSANGCSQDVSQVPSGAQTVLATADLASTAGVAFDGRIIYSAPASGGTLNRWVISEAPPVPSVSSPLGLQVQHSSWSALTWQAARTANGDAILYSVYFSSVPDDLVLIGTTSATSFDTPDLHFGTAYYWRVVAQDTYDGFPLLTSSSLILNFSLELLNNPPGAFSVASGTGTEVTRSTSVAVGWQASIDPDGDAVVYNVSFGSAAGSFSLVETTSTSQDFGGLFFGTTYYWSVAAEDIYGATTTVSGGMQSYLPVFLNDPPQAVQLAVPSPQIQTMSDQAVLSWRPVNDPQSDPITYTVSLGASPQNLAPVADISQSTQTGAFSLEALPSQVSASPELQTNGGSIQVTFNGLSYYQDYYVSVAAANPYGASSVSPPQSFSLSSAPSFPKAYNYPNPFSPEQGGTNIVFNTPASGYHKATVEIYSEWQDLLFKRDYYGIPPGVSQVHFNGRDRYGRDFFDGSYVCRVVFSGPSGSQGSATQTFYMLVVK